MKPAAELADRPADDAHDDNALRIDVDAAVRFIGDTFAGGTDLPSAELIVAVCVLDELRRMRQAFESIAAGVEAIQNKGLMGMFR